MKTLRRIFNVLLIGVIICMLMSMFSTHKTTRRNVSRMNGGEEKVLHDSTERRNRWTGEVEYIDHLYEDEHDTNNGHDWNFIGKDK